MKTDRLLVAACASLALAFIFSCSSEGDGSSSDDGGSSSSNDSNCPIDGYRTVEINGQIWMAENLNCNVSGSKCYGEDGRVIMGYDQEADEDIFTTLSPAEVQANCEKYGRLYDWFTANKVCPSGWHLPSNEDWDKLYSFVEDGECEYYDESNNYDGIEGYCPTAGKHLKSDRHGFLALPGGVSVTSTSTARLEDSYSTELAMLATGGVVASIINVATPVIWVSISTLMMMMRSGGAIVLRQ